MKVLIIGIDGGTFDIIRPLVQQGDLPNIASLMKAGVSSELQSTIPPVTAPAWVSFMTGKKPGKHSIFHFICNTHRNYSGTILSAADIKSKTLWSILSEYRKRLILINIPLMYPPANINGILIPGIGTPPESHNFTYPESIYQELLREIGDYKIDYWGKNILNAKGDMRTNLQKLIDNLNYITTKRTETVLYLHKKYPWDLSMVVYVITDRFQHMFWKFMDVNHPAYNSKLAKLFGQAVMDGYRKVDEAIGKILKEIGDDVTVIVMSDHGFGPLYKCFFINKWLRQKGMLKLNYALPWRLQFANPPLKRILMKLGLNCFDRILPEKALLCNIPSLKIVRKRWVELINWNKTKAYSPDSLGINVNLKGREPKGIVNPGETFEKLLSTIEDELYRLRDQQTAELVIDRVGRKEEVYTGPYVDDSVDLLFVMKGMSYQPYSNRFFSRGLFGSPPNHWSGNHRFNGMLIMKGPNINPEASLKQSRIIDIAPTVLYLFDKPIPKDMDGRVLEEAIIQDILEKRPILYTDPENTQEESKKDSISEKEEEQVRKHLKDLGYF